MSLERHSDLVPSKIDKYSKEKGGGNKTLCGWQQGFISRSSALLMFEPWLVDVLKALTRRSTV